MNDSAHHQRTQDATGNRIRVVISGMDCVTPLGDDASLAAHLHHGTPPFMPAPVLPGAAWCPVNAFDPAQATDHWRHRRYLSRGGLFALASALGAARDAGWGASAPDGAALVTAHGPNLDITSDFPHCHCDVSGTGDTQGDAPSPCATSTHGGPTAACGVKGMNGVDGPDEARHGLSRDTAGLDHPGLDALWLLRWLPNTAASAIAQRLGIHGEGLVVGTACAAGLQALGEAYRRVRHGLAPTVLAAGGDSRLSAGGMLGYARADALWHSNARPASHAEALRAMRPFDAAHGGFVPGEGGAAFVLETEAAACARGATIHGEILGFGATLDGASLTAPDATAHHAECTVRKALDDAGLTPGDIAWVAAHGTSTPRGDAAEALLLQRVFTDAGHRPAVTALKSWTGHLASACGLAECALMLRAARCGVLPSIRNLDTPCSPAAEGLDLVREPRPFPQGPGLIQSFGFGGQNAALIVMPAGTRAGL
jgi:3-oxoacyl-[acyl-carrier-protein] synthase II